MEFAQAEAVMPISWGDRETCKGGWQAKTLSQVRNDIPVQTGGKWRGLESIIGRSLSVFVVVSDSAKDE